MRAGQLENKTETRSVALLGVHLVYYLAALKVLLMADLRAVSMVSMKVVMLGVVMVERLDVMTVAYSVD